MILHCHSRKCNTTKDHKLKVETNEAICMDCAETNNMVTDFIKNAMKSSGEIYRSVRGRKAFMYRCPKCTIDRRVKIVDEQAICEACNHPLNLSSPMVQAIKTTIDVSPKSEEIDVDDLNSPKTEVSKGMIKRRKE